MHVRKTLAVLAVSIFCSQVVVGCSDSRVQVDRFRYPVLKEREGGSIFEAKRRVIDAYRLKPDGRFTGAIGEIYTVVTGKPKPDVNAQLDGRVWKLSCEGIYVGSLPNRPTFVQALTMLKAWAKKLGKEGGLSQPSPPPSPLQPSPPPSPLQPSPPSSPLQPSPPSSPLQPSPPSSPLQPSPPPSPLQSSPPSSPLQSSPLPQPPTQASLPLLSPAAALKHLHDQTTPAATPTTAPIPPAHAACSLSFLSFDETEVSELIPTRALALLSMEDWQNTGHAKAASMLACSMGYRADAQSLASLIPDAGDPVKLYLMHNKDALAKRAAAIDAREEEKYLYLRILSERQDPHQWFPAMRKLLGSSSEWTLPVVSLMCQSFADKRARRHAADGLISASLAELRVHSGGSAPPPVLDILESPAGIYFHIEDPSRRRETNPGERVQMIDRELAAAAFAQSPLWKDDSMWKAYYRAALYSALFEIGTYQVEPARTEEGVQFVTSIGAREGEQAQQFHKIMADTLAASLGDRNPAKLRDDISLSKAFGGAVKTWLYRSAANIYRPDEPGLYATGRRLFASLDARPDNLGRLSTVCREYLLNIPLSESLSADGEAAGEVSGRADHMQGDRDVREDRVQKLVAEASSRWKSGSYSDAAKLMQSYKYPLTWIDWRWSVGPKFVEAFGDRQEEALKAANALSLYGFTSSQDCGQLAVAAFDSKQYQLAFEIDSRMLTAGTRGQELENLSTIAHGYKCLKQLKNEKEALTWLEENVPIQFRNPLSMFAFSEGQYELLFNAVNKEPTGFGAEFVWMVRAAAAIDRQNKIEAGEKKEVVEHFKKKRSSPEFYYEVGRYLLGIGNVSELNGRNLDSKQMLEAAYFLGWKAESEFNYEEASQWYYTALETGQTTVPEYKWAYEKLIAWKSMDQSLAEIASADARKISNKSNSDN